MFDLTVQVSTMSVIDFYTPAVRCARSYSRVAFLMDLPSLWRLLSGDLYCFTSKGIANLRRYPSYMLLLAR
jgi:hypothetical protein